MGAGMHQKRVSMIDGGALSKALLLLTLVVLLGACSLLPPSQGSGIERLMHSKEPRPFLDEHFRIQEITNEVNANSDPAEQLSVAISREYAADTVTMLLRRAEESVGVDLGRTERLVEMAALVAQSGDFTARAAFDQHAEKLLGAVLQRDVMSAVRINEVLMHYKLMSYKQTGTTQTATTNSAVVTGSGSMSYSRVGGSRPEARPSELPRLRWPISTPSSRYTVAGSLPREQTFDHAFSWLREALATCGFDSVATHEIEDGFVVVTPQEQIFENGAPKGTEERWTVGKNKSVGEMLVDILTGDWGYYRYFVFVFSAPFEVSSQQPDFLEVMGGSKTGLNGLPKKLEGVRYGKRHLLEVLVYQFSRNEDSGEMWYVSAPKVNAAEHLRVTGLLDALEAKR